MAEPFTDEELTRLETLCKVAATGAFLEATRAALPRLIARIRELQGERDEAHRRLRLVGQKLAGVIADSDDRRCKTCGRNRAWHEPRKKAGHFDEQPPHPFEPEEPDHA
jgi:hypothetical protein